jgi:hypothetical protein
MPCKSIVLKEFVVFRIIELYQWELIIDWILSRCLAVMRAEFCWIKRGSGQYTHKLHLTNMSAQINKYFHSDQHTVYTTALGFLQQSNECHLNHAIFSLPPLLKERK